MSNKASLDDAGMLATREKHLYGIEKQNVWKSLRKLRNYWSEKKHYIIVFDDASVSLSTPCAI